MKSISDVVGGSGLAHFAEIALLIFFAVFMAVGVRALFTSRAVLDDAARLPFDDPDPCAAHHPVETPQRDDA